MTPRKRKRDETTSSKIPKTEEIRWFWLCWVMIDPFFLHNIWRPCESPQHFISLITYVIVITCIITTCSMLWLFIQLWDLPRSTRRSKYSRSRKFRAIHVARYIIKHIICRILFFQKISDLTVLFSFFFCGLTAVHYDPGTTKPISCSLKSLDELLSWKRTEASPFNVATVPLASRLPQLDRCPRRTLVSHDMMGGYLHDRYNSRVWCATMLCRFH